MKRWRLALALLLALLLCGCTAAVNPLARVEATDAPGLSMTLHPATASQSNANELQATLYYRFLTQPMLACESRTLTVKRDESPELAVVNALLEGPSAGNAELIRLFPETVTVESVQLQNGLLFVVLSDALLRDDGVPTDWLTQSQWRSEAPLRRRLTIQSLVCSLVETFDDASVQVMIREQGGAKTTSRLDNGYFLGEATGPSDPQTRDESLLLTPHNAAAALLRACVERDYQTLYAYTAAQTDGVEKPVYDAFASEVQDVNKLSDVSASEGNVSPDGRSACLNVEMSMQSESRKRTVTAYPLRLVREGGAWKLPYDRLLALLKQ